MSQSSVSDEILKKVALNVFLQSGEYNAVAQIRGSVFRGLVEAMRQRFVETAGHEPSESEIAHIKQLVVTLWNSMVCIPEGSDPFNIVAPQHEVEPPA